MSTRRLNVVLTGIELAASIRNLAHDTLPSGFWRIRPDYARVILFGSGPILLAGLAKWLAAYVRTRLERLWIEVHAGVKAATIYATGFVAAFERTFSNNLFWSAGVAATPAAVWIGAVMGKHGTIQVASDCLLPGQSMLAGVAPLAKQQGRYVAGVIAARAWGSGGSEAVPVPVSGFTGHYRPDMMVLETRFETAEGTFALIDLMPYGKENPSVVRMRLHLTMRFDYGFPSPWVTQLDDGSGFNASLCAAWKACGGTSIVRAAHPMCQ